MKHKPTAIIVGAGVAGLATAIRLAVQGFAVTVFEKNNYAGGKIASFNLSNYQFDEGPSLFTQPENIEELFTLAGKNIADYFSYVALPIACRYFFENGKVVNAYTDKDAFAHELEKTLHEEGSSVYRYLTEAEKLYNNVGKIFLNYSLHTSTILNAPLKQAVATVKPSLLFQSLNAYNKARFSQPETVQIFNRFATYNGSNPYKAPAMLSLIPHLEQNLGTFYPKNGMISIGRALHKLALDCGVIFKFNTTVEQIITKNNRATGVKVGGQIHSSDLIVSNMDVYFTYKHLLNNNEYAQKILKQERSSSAIIFYWGIKKSFEQLQLHNIFFTEDYQQEFEHIFTKRSLYHDPTIYINITSKMEAGQAPEGCENWFVMVNAPANTGQNWQQLQQQCRAAIITKLNRMLKVNLQNYIEEEQVMDPVDIERKTSSYMGSLYGTSSNGKMAAFLRHPNFSTKISGLYFAGGSVHPGGGIPLCLHSAKLVSSMVKNDLKKLIPS